MFHIFAASRYSYSVICNVLRCPSVCPSVRSSRSCIVSQRVNTSLNVFSVW